MQTTRLAAVPLVAVAALIGAFPIPNAHAQIDQDLVEKALAEARKSDRDTRQSVTGTLAVYGQLPKSVKGGDEVPATKGHPFSASPLVTEQERKDAEKVVMPLMTIFRGADHGDRDAIVESSRMFEKHMANLPVPSHLNDKLGHVKKCPACAAHVSHMIYQHEEAVASAPVRKIVLFHLGDDQLTPMMQDSVRDFALTVRNHPGARVCLIGRASRIGGWQFNCRLSECRSDAVADALRDYGIPGERITTLWLGFDSPQLSPLNCSKYDLDSVFRKAGSQRMNQSVMMVLYFDHPDSAAIGDPASGTRELVENESRESKRRGP